MNAYRRMGAVIVLLLTILTTTSAVLAQGPTATPSVLQTGYPVAVHQGTCDDPTAEPAFDLNTADPYGAGSDDAETLGTSSTTPVLEANATIDAGLDDLASGGNVIAVHASAEDYATIILCGQIAGTSTGGKLVFALLPVGEITMSGIAILEDDGDQTQATVYLTTQAEGGALATPAMTPTPLVTPTPS